MSDHYSDCRTLMLGWDCSLAGARARESHGGDWMHRPAIALHGWRSEDGPRARSKAHSPISAMSVARIAPENDPDNFAKLPPSKETLIGNLFRAPVLPGAA